MPEDNLKDTPKESPRSAAPRRARRFITRRNAFITAIGLTAAVIALILVGFLAYRLGFVDN